MEETAQLVGTPGTVHEKSPRQESSTRPCASGAACGILEVFLIPFPLISVYTMRPSTVKKTRLNMVQLSAGHRNCQASHSALASPGPLLRTVPGSLGWGQMRVSTLGCAPVTPPPFPHLHPLSMLPLLCPCVRAWAGAACVRPSRSPCFPCSVPLVLLWFDGPVIISFLRGKNLRLG